MHGLGTPWPSAMTRSSRGFEPPRRLRSSRQSKVVGGPERGTEYDLTLACNCCGSGAVQRSPLLVHRRQLPTGNGFIQTQSGEWLMSRRLVDAVADVLCGVKLWPVRDPDVPGELDWIQLIPETEMRLFAGTTKGVLRERACPCCDRDGYF